MTTLIEILRADLKAARLAAGAADATAEAKIKATLLSTMASDATKVGKDDRNGSREPTDAEVLKVAGKFNDGVRDMLANLAKAAAANPNAPADPRVARHEVERDVLAAFLSAHTPAQPKQMTSAELEAEIKTLVAGLAEKNPKQVGAVMAGLKAKFAGQYDAAAASGLVKKALA